MKKVTGKILKGSNIKLEGEFQLPIGKTASRLYSLDLMGSAAGALLTGALLIPLLSIPVVLVLLAFFNLIAFILLPAAVQK